MKSWDTRHLQPGQRFGYWREVLCEAFTALDPHAPRAGDYRSTVTLHELAQVNAAELHSFAQTVRRGRSEIRRRGDAFFFANLQLAGVCGVEQDGRRIRVEPGSFYLVDTTRPYTLDFEDPFHTLSFRIPHHALLPRLAADPRRVTARVLGPDDALGQLASTHMQGLMRCAPLTSAESGATLSQTLTELIALAVRGTRQATADTEIEDAQGSIAREAFQAGIVRHVITHAADPALCLPQVAAHFRVSVRTVQSAFAARQASFAQTVLDERLRLAAELLRRSSLRITDAALHAGFGDPSYFGRAFRRAFGCTPREYRRTQGRGPG